MAISYNSLVHYSLITLSIPIDPKHKGTALYITYILQK